MPVGLNLDPSAPRPGRRRHDCVDERPPDPRAHVIRVYEEVRHHECVVAKGPRGRETDDATRHLGDQHAVVFGWRLENRQLRVLVEKVPIPFIGWRRTAEDRCHGRKIVKRAGPHEHRHIVAQRTILAAKQRSLCASPRGP
ncbi:MAG: hypothetical protein M3450_11790 [Actinomycetota bacterium]|nr:hypothetical protein [Actinomycetota bacterium]